MHGPFIIAGLTWRGEEIYKQQQVCQSSSTERCNTMNKHLKYFILLCNSFQAAKKGNFVKPKVTDKVDKFPDLDVEFSAPLPPSTKKNLFFFFNWHVWTVEDLSKGTVLVSSKSSTWVQIMKT